MVNGKTGPLRRFYSVLENVILQWMQHTTRKYLVVIHCIFAGILFVSVPVHAVEGGVARVVEVIKVIDGDSLLVRDGATYIEVRLWGIDTPEYGQPQSGAAKEFSNNLVLNRQVFIEYKATDRFGRTVAMLQMEDRKYLNEELVKAGFAWVHIYYCKEPICDLWYRFEAEAREMNIGIWKEDNPTPPWEWKRKKRRYYK